VATDPTTLVHHLVEAHARRQPDASAVTCGTTSLSYAELDRAADRLAGTLEGIGLEPGQLVAVAMDRTIDVVVAMLGVLKAGGAYVPLEPNTPPDVLARLLADADPFAVLTHERHRVRLATRPDRPVICVDQPTDAAPGQVRTDTGLDAEPTAHRVRTDAALDGGAMACVIYTSGTTGTPVGAMLSHANLRSAFAGWQEVYQLTSDDRHLQIASVEFDVFTADWVRALGSGATLVLAERNFMHDRDADIGELYQLIVAAGITVVECNVPTLRLLFAHITSLQANLGAVRLLAVGTDRWYLDEHQAVQDYLGPNVRHLNTYGVVEATVDSTYFDLAQLRNPVDAPRRVSLIGVPFPHTRVHILAADGTPCPEGEFGEICLAGTGVGRGYWRQPELTTRRFQVVGTDVDPDGRVLRTGDLGRLRSDGILEFLGRTQAADRAGSGSGNRAAGGSGRKARRSNALATPEDIATVEAALRSHPDVREALVVADEFENGVALVAYVVTREGTTVDNDNMRQYLTGLIADRPVPHHFVVLDTLPRTRAGKIDRSGLPRPVATMDGPARAFGAAKSSFAGPAVTSGLSEFAIWAWLTLLFGAIGLVLTIWLWPDSMNLSGVSQPWSALFIGLYAIECLSFGLGVTFLIRGAAYLRQMARKPALTRAAHLAITWLLVAWLPQDSSYRLTAKTDWPAQATLVYTFNVTLMIVAAVLARFLFLFIRDAVRTRSTTIPRPRQPGPEVSSSDSRRS
jgi:amino acid adenylation domain-containing protein